MRKNIRDMTPEEIHDAGLQALERELGVVGMVRFLQQFEKGIGDYTKERYDWLREEDIETFVREIEQRHQPQS